MSLVKKKQIIQKEKKITKKLFSIVTLMLISASIISNAKTDMKYNMFNNEWSNERENSTLGYSIFDNTWAYSK
jgi:hypothetical protein